MPINLKENECLLRCSCYSLNHMALLIHEPDDSRGNNIKGEDDDWYLSFMLCDFPFWKRVWSGLKYVFNPSSLKYGMYGEIVLRTQDIANLEDFIYARRNGHKR